MSHHKKRDLNHMTVRGAKRRKSMLRAAVLFGFTITLLAAIAFVSSGASAGQESSEVVLIVPDEYEPTIALPYRTVNAETGAPAALYQVYFAAEGDSPEEMAAQYLEVNSKELHLLESDLSDLSHRVTREGLSGSVVRYVQDVNGVPVYKAEIAVKFNNYDQVTYVTSSYESTVDIDNVTPTLSRVDARKIAYDYLDIQEVITPLPVTLYVYQNQGQSILVYQVRVVAGQPLGDWEVLVDAHSGELIKVVDIAMDIRGAEGQEETSLVDGSGYVFDPDPLTSGTAQYGDTGFVDGNDAATPQLDGERSLVTLRDIQFDAGMYSLIGPYAEIQDFEGPFYGLFSQASDSFNYDRFDNEFEAVNTYYHIDSSMRYLNETLGLDIMPSAYPGGVRFDAHGLNGDDNSHYISGNQRVAFGEGGVDDAEDSDVIHHELGHGLHDWVTAGGLSQVNGLSEGIGDFWAQSYNRSVDSWTSSDPEYNWVFRWDGHNPFWNGRVTNYGALWPGGLVGQIHTDGQIWGTVMMKVWDAIGKTQTDTAHWEGIGTTGSSTDQNMAANAIMQAAIDLGYSYEDLTDMRDIFLATGYIIPPLPLADFLLQVDPAEQMICVPDEAVYTVQVQSTNGFTETIALSLSGEPISTTVDFSQNNAAAPFTSTLTISNTGSAAAGSYSLEITGISPSANYTTTVGLDLFDTTPAAVTLTSPGDGTTDVVTNPLFEWQAADQANSYLLEVDDDSGFGSIDYSATVTGATEHRAEAYLDPLTEYYWRVQAINPCGSGSSSAVFSFTTQDLAPVLLVDDDDNAPDVQGTYTAALDALLGAGGYDIWDTNNSDIEPDADLLSYYDSVIWFTGEEYQAPTGPGDDGEAALASWLDNSGCLFISSTDYHYAKGLTPFMENYLGVDLVDDDTGMATAEGQNAVFAGLGPYNLTYPGPDYSDEISPDGTAEVAFTGTNPAGDNREAAVYKEGSTYVTAFLGFPWEYIPSAGDREEVLTTFFDWCENGVEPSIDSTPSSIDEEMMANDVVMHTLTISNTGTGMLVWDIGEADGGNCASPGAIDWVSVSDSSGYTAEGESSEVVVTFDAGDLADDDYSGALCISSNDDSTPLVTVSLSMSVEWYVTYLPRLMK